MFEYPGRAFRMPASLQTVNDQYHTAMGQQGIVLEQEFMPFGDFKHA